MKPSMPRTPTKSRSSRSRKDTPPTVRGPRGGATGRERAEGEAASRLIDRRIAELGGWRGATLARMRALILEADPGMTEEWKWMGTPVWSHGGNVCTGEAYAKVVKLTFARGAHLADPARLFNSSLEGNTRRAIDLREGEEVDGRAFQALVRAAVARNLEAAEQRRAPRSRRVAAQRSTSSHPHVASTTGKGGQRTRSP
jgi:hypothetical protein